MITFYCYSYPREMIYSTHWSALAVTFYSWKSKQSKGPSAEVVWIELLRYHLSSITKPHPYLICSPHAMPTEGCEAGVNAVLGARMHARTRIAIYFLPRTKNTSNITCWPQHHQLTDLHLEHKIIDKLNETKHLLGYGVLLFIYSEI